jgi:hypothetical protein
VNEGVIAVLLMSLMAFGVVVITYSFGRIYRDWKAYRQERKQRRAT